MKFVGLLVGMWCLKVCMSDQLISRTGSLVETLSSDSPKRKAFVVYRLCLDDVPFFVRATVRTQDLSLPHRFNATVFEIFIEGFILEIERTDQPTGWQEGIVVDWTLYSGGNGIVLNGNYIWLTDPSTKLSQTRAQANESCITFGGKLVNVLDRKMFDTVSNYFMATYVGISYADVWLAMDYNQTDMTMTSSTGKQAFNSKWRPGSFPTSNTIYTAVVMRVVADPSTNSNWGLWDWPPIKTVTTYNLCSILL